MRKIALVVVVLLAIIGAVMLAAQYTNAHRFDSAQWKAANSDNYEVREPMCAGLSSRLIGKTEQELFELLGKPDYKELGYPGPATGGRDIWSYIVRMQGEPGGGRYTEFQVTLKNDRVVSCKVATRVSAA